MAVSLIKERMVIGERYIKNWENELKRLAIKAEQQFDYVSGKIQLIWRW